LLEDFIHIKEMRQNLKVLRMQQGQGQNIKISAVCAHINTHDNSLKSNWLYQSKSSEK